MRFLFTLKWLQPKGQAITSVIKNVGKLEPSASRRDAKWAAILDINVQTHRIQQFLSLMYDREWERVTLTHLQKVTHL